VDAVIRRVIDVRCRHEVELAVGVEVPRQGIGSEVESGVQARLEGAVADARTAVAQEYAHAVVVIARYQVADAVPVDIAYHDGLGPHASGVIGGDAERAVAILPRSTLTLLPYD